MNLWQKITELWAGWKRRLATAGVSFIAVYVAYFVIFGANGYLAYRHKRVEYLKLQNEVEQIKAENEKLTGNIKSLKSDPKAIEKEAREQLRYAKPGEVIYVMPERKTPAATPPATAKK